MNKKLRPLALLPSLLLAVLFAGIMTLAQSFQADGTAGLLTESRASLLTALLFFAERTLLFFLALALFGWLLQRKGPGLAFLRRPGAVWLTAGLLLVCWLPYFVCTFPGTVSNDSITQLKEIYGVKPLSNGNPVFQTFLLWAFCQIGNLLQSPNAAVALYCVAQALLMALLLSHTLKAMERAASPRFLTLAAFLLYALCPIFPLFAFCVGKDTNFAMAVLFLSLMVWRVVCQPEGERLPGPALVGLCASGVLVMLLRNPGLYLAALTLFLLLLWTLQKKQRATGRLWRAPALGLVVLALSFNLWHGLALPLVQAEPMPEAEEYSVPLQQVARVVVSQPETLSHSEIAAISAVLDFSRIRAEYRGELSDPIKNLWNESASPQAKATFFRTWLSMAPKHPGTYFSATFHNTYGYLAPGYLSTLKPTLLIGKQGHTTDLDGRFDFSVNPNSGPLKAAMDRLSAFPLARWLLAPGLYGWVALFAFFTLLASRQKKLLLPAFPALFTLLGCLFSAVNGYFRYAMPLYFSAPLLLALCAQAGAPWTHHSTKEKRQ